MSAIQEQVSATSAFNRAMFAHTLAAKVVLESVCERGFIGDAPIDDIRAATDKINAAIAALEG